MLLITVRPYSLLPCSASAPCYIFGMEDGQRATMSGPASRLRSPDEKKAEIDTARERMSKMSDGELLRHGMKAKVEYEDRLREAEVPADRLVTELSEARAEWNRRYKKMPLRDSF